MVYLQGRRKHKKGIAYGGNFLYGFVKIILTKNGNFDLALRKRLFCNAKPTLLPCKTAAFGMRNNRFCNALIVNTLHNGYTREKCLQFFSRSSTLETRWAGANS